MLNMSTSMEILRGPSFEAQTKMPKVFRFHNSIESLQKTNRLGAQPQLGGDLCGERVQKKI